ncbi:unnamed protein product, partial [Choristocarpus tenellus]
MMAAVLNMMATIWESIAPSLEMGINRSCLDLIVETIDGEMLALLHRQYCSKPGPARGAFMRLAGLAGDDLAPGMLEEVVVEMLGLPEDAQPSAYGPTVALLCSWGQHGHLVGAIVDSLQSAFHVQSLTLALAIQPSSALTDSPTVFDGCDRSLIGGRGKRRRSAADNAPGPHGLPPTLALNMLSHLLAGGGGHPATVAARSSIMSSHNIVKNIK